MDAARYLADEFRQHQEVAAATCAAVEAPFLRLLDACTDTITRGGKILLFGNGGSAADAQHLATELAVRYSKDRKPIAALALTTDTSALTAIGNDYSFSHLFARQIEALAKPEDTAIGITTSGNSENVLRGLEAARNIGAVAAALTGGPGGRLHGLADPLLCVPSAVTARIQEMHITIGQILCGALEQRLGLI
jgi:D-sedoheptulose 7-phosphate isomerase